ncbi:hypothetical protein L1987_22606 [Smallanthus sonchifolius]|uniref:Uncharacterized protein n=1 Tax=Smallanthus sonchifolius TaxID=185202 RepID=A0ACB9IF61_9ASTR|nr:hypothetical protein L1987_22606 [Smallanthus sonchifolius]
METGMKETKRQIKDDRSTFERIGNSRGTVVDCPEISEADGNLSFDLVGIVVNDLNKIAEKIHIEWGGRVFPVWLQEDHRNWVPEFAQVNRKSPPEPCSPTPVNRSSSSPASKISCTRSVEGGSQQSPGTVLSSPGASKAQGVKSAFNSDLPHADSNLQDNNIMAVSGLQLNSVSSPIQLSQQAQSGVMGSDPFGLHELIFNIGAQPKRKRHTPIRYPNSLSRARPPLSVSRKRVKRKLPPSAVLDSDLEMEKEVSLGEDQIGEVMPDRVDIQVDLNRAPSFLENSQEVIEELIGEEDLELVKIAIIDKEIQSTVDVAMCIGIDLSQHAQQVEDLIQGGGDVNFA